MGAWWHPKAVLAADFYNGRYGLFARESVLTSLEGTVRASEHRILDANGVWQTIGNDLIARQDSVGAYIGGQMTNVWGSPDNLNDISTWAKQWTPVVAADGDFYDVTDDSPTLAEQLLGQSSIPADTTTYNMLVDIKKDDEASIHRYVQFRLYGGTARAQTIIINTATGAYRFPAGNGTPSVDDLGDRWRLRVRLTNNGTNTLAQAYLGPCYNTNINATSVDATLMSTASFSWPHCYSGAYLGVATRVKGTRQASVVSASASGGAPFAGFTESGLASALSARVKFQLTHVGDGVTRPLVGISDGTVNNRLRFLIDTDDKPAVAVISGGVTLATAKLASALTAGTYVLAANFDPANGLYLVRGDTGEQASAALSAMPSGLNLLRYGSSVGENYLNDYLHEVQVAQVMTQAEAKNWAQNILTASLSVVCRDDVLAASAEARIDAQVSAIMEDAVLAATAEVGINASLAVTCDDDTMVSDHDYVPTYLSQPVVSTKPRSRGKHIAAQPRASHTPARPRGAHTPARPRNSR